MRKKEKMLNAMDLIDDKYIAEAANPVNVKIIKNWRRYSLIAACLMVLGLYLFWPLNTNPPDVSEYSGSEYYPIIQKLNVATFQKPVYKNNFTKINAFLSSFYYFMKYGADYNAPDTDNTPPDNRTYVETTDNQVAGVIEADLIRRTDRYIFYLNGTRLEVYEILGEETAMVNTFTVDNTTFMQTSNITYSLNSLYDNQCEFFLSDDGKTITVLVRCLADSKRYCVGVISLDVSNPLRITAKKSVFVSGAYLTSRMVDGELLLINRFTVGKNPNFSDEASFLPQIDAGDGMKSIPADHIISPDTVDAAQYTVVCKLDEATLEVKDAKAFLSYAGDIYVSTNSIYTTRTYYAQKGEDKFYAPMTEILRIYYKGEGLDYKGSVSIDGFVNNQYSLDEYENILRVVTTTNAQSGSSASLYCIDLETLQIAAAVKDFAPLGETVRSVRFDKQAAYVCTSVQLTDPVFFFDLRDLNNITYTDTGTIEGFSTSLVNFGDGYLLGIGTGAEWTTLKIEIYKEAENRVVSVCKYEIKYTMFSEEYKSYFIDRKNKLIGLGYTDYNDSIEDRYILLKLEDDELKELVNAPLAGDNEKKRAVLIDDCFYMFSPLGFLVREIQPDIRKN